MTQDPNAKPDVPEYALKHMEFKYLFDMWQFVAGTKASFEAEEGLKQRILQLARAEYHGKVILPTTLEVK